MAFEMKFDQSALEGIKPVPQGVYKVILTGFKPKISSKGTSTNLNPQAKIVDHPDFAGQMIFTNLNSSIPSFIQDFVHSFGIPMEDQLGPSPSIPGSFDGDEVDPSTWKYDGPLLGKVATWEVGIKIYEKKEQNELVRFICSVPNCNTEYPAVKHSHDMRKKGN